MSTEKHPTKETSMSNKKSTEETPVEWTDEMWMIFATLIGFNMLAEQQDTLGSKVYCRICRDVDEKALVNLH
jgi:hypothetical protein